MKTMMKKFIVICLALFVVSGIFLYVNSSFISHDNKEIEDRAHIVGIDVSHHNGLKSISTLPDSIKFVYIKASQGKTFHDPAFNQNYNLFSQKAPHKVAIGAYHFFEQEISADEQFKNLNSAIGDKKFDLPVVVDFEFVHYSSKEELKAIQNTLLSLLKQIEAKYHKEPLIYCNPKGYRLFIGNDKALSEYRIWLDGKLYNDMVPNTIIKQKKIIDLCNSKVDINYSDSCLLISSGR